MEPRESFDDEGAPPQAYRDDETANTSFAEPADVPANSETSGDEYYSPQEPYYANKYIPPRLQRIWNNVVVWVKGPQPPRPWKIHPFFSKIQTAPIQLLNNYFPERRQKIALLAFFYFCWLLTFGLVLHRSAFAADIPGYGSPVRIRCTDRFWSDGNGCGLNGDLCRPFENSTMPFRCPANCRREQLLNPHAVGDKNVNYHQLVIGGPTDEQETLENTYYRADSFICGAAIHAGFINDASGGCGVVAQIGEKIEYPSVNRRHIKSIGFDSYFPRSFSFLSGTQAKCRDLRWPLLGVSLTFTILLSLFTTSPSVFFSSIFFGVFFHVALASDPPNLTDYYSIISIALARFLPASFCMYAVYQFAVRRQLQGLHAQVEKTILWLGGCWIGALNNYTFDKIPIERLTPHDIKNQPGAIPALIIIVLILFTIALGQAWSFRVEGRLPRYLAIYGALVGGILALVAIPKMNVRIHHYILGLLLVPGTSMQTRPSLLFQGILIGLFINGTARWGFASILETPSALRGDAPMGTLLPIITAPIIHNNLNIHHLRPNITFDWHFPFPEPYDGISVLVNDVERYHEYADRMEESWTWTRHMENVNEYFRFGYLKGGGRGDYTKAGVWRADGGWTEMASGPS
ncbi:lccl domain containing protein [Alternaria burnsii]|uniref:Lccl domain containing protein n=1 Tax=Alternaria burnsii TaxID=1187904 RepID=A0A8H7B9F6_9PLEO|nr:lccl domain containing protein [Alternaria burnsii]KAF7680256.1 lccl domain containing protein [Alternaria burnsii]